MRKESKHAGNGPFGQGRQQTKIFLKHPTFQGFFFIFSWNRKLTAKKLINIKLRKISILTTQFNVGRFTFLGRNNARCFCLFYFVRFKSFLKKHFNTQSLYRLILKHFQVADVYFLQEITIRGRKSFIKSKLRMIFNMV